jgi:hypothetical protein
VVGGIGGFDIDYSFSSVEKIATLIFVCPFFVEGI